MAAEKTTASLEKIKTSSYFGEYEKGAVSAAIAKLQAQQNNAASAHTYTVEEIIDVLQGARLSKFFTEEEKRSMARAVTLIKKSERYKIV